MFLSLKRWIGEFLYRGGGGWRAPIVKRARPVRLVLEHLEDRTAPALFSWIGAGNDSLWENPANWDQNDLPALSDDVYIGSASGPVVNESGEIQAHSVMSLQALVIHGSLTISGSASLGAQLTLEGSLTLLPNASLYATGLDLAGQVHLASGSQLLSYGSSSLHGSASIDGAGKWEFTSGVLTVEGDHSVSNLDFLAGSLVSYPSKSRRLSTRAISRKLPDCSARFPESRRLPLQMSYAPWCPGLVGYSRMIWQVGTQSLST